MVSTPTRTRGKHRPRRHGQRPPGEPAPAKRLRPLARGRADLPRILVSAGRHGQIPQRSTYYLILGATLALTAIGILMVLSASSVEAIAAGESPYSRP